MYILCHIPAFLTSGFENLWQHPEKYSISLIVLRNVGDELYTSNPNWFESINLIKLFSKISLTMAMAAIGLSTNLKDIKSMGYKPFIVGFIAMLTVGVVCILTIESYLRFFI